jgi:hypothetical protein
MHGLSTLRVLALCPTNELSAHGVLHLSRRPTLVFRTRSIIGVLSGSNSAVRAGVDGSLSRPLRPLPADATRNAGLWPICSNCCGGLAEGRRTSTRLFARSGASKRSGIGFDATDFWPLTITPSTTRPKRPVPAWLVAGAVAVLRTGLVFVVQRWIRPGKQDSKSGLAANTARFSPPRRAVLRKALRAPL